MKEQKTNNGITLIALIITVIVLLILAIVSIKLLLDNGIIGHANKAAKGYTVEQEKELIAEGYANYKMAKYAATDTTEVEKLQKYFDLGLENVLDQEKMQNSGNLEFLKNDIIPDADTSLSAIGYVEDNNEIYYRLSYKNNTYRMFLEEDNSTEIGMKVKKIEFESTLINSNEETEDLNRLRYYFKSRGIAEREYGKWDGPKFVDNDIIKGSSEIKLLGQSLTGCSIQYKDYIYKLTLELPQSCWDNYEFKDIEIEGVTFIQDILNVQGATTKGNEQDGWVITFDKSGNVYTLLSNGEITSGETQNPGTPVTKVNLKELIDTEYAENNDRIITLAYMEETISEAESKFAGISIVNKKFIVYASSSTGMCVMPLENMTVQEFAEGLGVSVTNTNVNITELKANMWYGCIGDAWYGHGNGEAEYSILLERTMPNSIIYNFADENINNKKVYNAIITNNTETPTRINLKELATSKLQANNKESMNVALDNQNASITISKINTNIVVIFISQDGEKYFKSMEDTNTKDIATLFDEELKEKDVKSDMWYQVEKNLRETNAIHVGIPGTIYWNFEFKDILDRELYLAIIEDALY